mmetsp:Transcript_75906/g.210697  ORF Transcript_75906/g.210697 Transcript_75906/m.210697 type:complete len:645 (-) Transcript_75906:37-1971(-)
MRHGGSAHGVGLRLALRKLSGAKLAGPNVRLASAVAALNRDDDVLVALYDCSRARSPLSKELRARVASQLVPRLATTDSHGLVEAACACAAARASDATVLEAIARRAAQLVEDEGGVNGDSPLGGRHAVKIVNRLGQLCTDGRRGAASAATSVAKTGKMLELVIARRVSQLSMADLGASLRGLAALGVGAKALVPAARPRVRELVDSTSSSHDFDPHDGVRLVAAYARLGVRDKTVLSLVTDALAASCSRGRLVSPEFLLSLVHSLVTKLRPPPSALAAVIEASLPSAITSYSIPELVLVVPALAFVPGLRAERRHFGRVVFGACLSAPLGDFRPRALVGVMRSAKALEHRDVDFWVAAMSEAEKSMSAEGSSNSTWPIDAVTGVAHMASHIVAGAQPATAAEAGLLDASATVAIWATNTGPPLRAMYPAADCLLRAALVVAGARIQEFTPKDLGLLAVVLTKAKVDDGPLFALLAHQALELLQPSEVMAIEESDRGATAAAKFNCRDIAQVLVALATFGYRDDQLLRVLTRHVEEAIETYDAVARDIVLWSLAELGGVGVSSDHCPTVADLLIEYELSKKRNTERTEEHLMSTEVFPASEPWAEERGVAREATPADSEEEEEEDRRGAYSGRATLRRRRGVTA